MARPHFANSAEYTQPRNSASTKSQAAQGPRVEVGQGLTAGKRVAVGLRPWQPSQRAVPRPDQQPHFYFCSRAEHSGLLGCAGEMITSILFPIAIFKPFPHAHMYVCYTSLCSCKKCSPLFLPSMWVPDSKYLYLSAIWAARFLFWRQGETGSHMTRITGGLRGPPNSLCR